MTLEELLKAQTKRYEKARQLGCNKETLYNFGYLAAMERQELAKGSAYWDEIMKLRQRSKGINPDLDLR